MEKIKNFPCFLLLIAVLCSSTFVFAQDPLTKPSKRGGTINGRDYVNLGLSVKWATCNVGASEPSDYGNYYAWGETTTKPTYTEVNYTSYKKNMANIGGSRYDVARVNWGATWRLPTYSELTELKEKCKWVWTSQGGHYGYRITGPSVQSIFLPAAGRRCGSSLSYTDEGGYYWSSTPHGSDTEYAYYLNFYSSDYDSIWGHRDYGRNVRPVSE